MSSAERWWWPTPNAALADAGATGEILVARIRLVLACTILGVPLAGIVTGYGGPEYYLAAFFAATTAVLALAVYRLALRRLRLRWLGFATSLSDVTIVTLLHVSYLAIGMPAVAANSRTSFSCYMLAIAATAMRWDVRICVAAGALAILQYAGISATSWFMWADAPTPDTVAYGEIAVGQQLARLLLLVAATFISVAIVRQSGSLRLSSTHDALTGIHNRSYFHERLDEEFERARRSQRPLAIAMVDLDHFKRVNDVHGHVAGDEALRVVARVLRDGLRRTDLVARYGGEEFIVALPESGEEDAAVRLEKLRAAVEDAVVSIAGSDTPLRLSASIGVAAFPVDGSDIDALIRIADERLLAAKQGGRNRVVAGAFAG